MNSQRNKSASASASAAAASDPDASSLIRFVQLVDGGRPPRRADRSVGGTLPGRALAYCEPVAAASALGWHIFLARRFRLLWDGSEVFWQVEGMSQFEPLRCVHYPGFEKAFDEHAPAVAKGYAPPFLSASIQPGVVQVWPGAMAQTRQGWSVLVRPVANLARPSGYELFEGIIETDNWFGPLFTNLRLTRTNVPVEFDDDVPFLQVQVLEKGRYDERFHADYGVENGLGAFTPEDWARYEETIVKPCANPDRRHGAYARRVRKANAERLRSVEIPGSNLMPIRLPPGQVDETD